jgi:N-acetylglutamate synthase-like GNAT family acetyltransferase
MNVSIRKAEPSDAEAIIEIVRSSIVTQCASDHRNDADTLTHWLSNKTPQNFLTWISNPDNFCVVAESDKSLKGVGLLHRSGEIRLFYLSPTTLRQGLGRAIYSALEEAARRWGLEVIHLHSTPNARFFYEAQGFVATGPAIPQFGVLQGYPYVKHLQPN